MSEPSALYCRVRLTRPAFEAFLQSPLAAPPTYDDWGVWLEDAPLYGVKEFVASIQQMRPLASATVASLVKEWLAREDACARSEYDPHTQTWSFGIVEFAEEYDSLVREFAALRAIAAYKDLPGSDFVIVLPYLYGGDDGLSGAMLIDRGSSSLVKELPPSATEEAKSFFRTTYNLARSALDASKG